MSRSARYRLAKRKHAKPKRSKKKFLFVFFLILFSSVILYLIFSFRVWDGKSRISIAVPGQDKTQVMTLDPSTSSITQIYIPNTTEVHAANNMGKWKLGSIWKLGENEGLNPGRFLSITLMKSFSFPIEAWDFDGRTNLSLRDRINIAIFKAHVKNSSKTEINLEETGFITAVKLTDGTRGYTIKERIPVRLLSVFVDEEIAKKNVNVKIVNKTGDRIIADTVSEIVDVVGMKVTSATRLDPDDSDCVVKGDGREVREKIAKLFECKSEPGVDNSLEITLGKKFLKRF